MENINLENKELNCVKCGHKGVCKYATINRQAWEKLMVSQEYQHLVNHGMNFIVSCEHFIAAQGKILRGE